MLLQQAALREWTYPEIRVRSASPPDCREVVRVINRVAAEQRYLQTDRFVPDARWKTLLRRPFNLQAGYLLLILEDQRTVAGFCRLFPDGAAHPAGQVGNVGVVLLPEYRSRGLGSRLLSCLLDFAPQCGYAEIRADILESNLPSLGLFHKLGFRKLYTHEVRLSYISQPVNEVVVARATQRGSTHA